MQVFLNISPEPGLPFLQCLCRPGLWLSSCILGALWPPSRIHSHCFVPSLKIEWKKLQAFKNFLSLYLLVSKPRLGFLPLLHSCQSSCSYLSVECWLHSSSLGQMGDPVRSSKGRPLPSLGHNLAVPTPTDMSFLASSPLPPLSKKGWKVGQWPIALGLDPQFTHFSAAQAASWDLFSSQRLVSLTCRKVCVAGIKLKPSGGPANTIVERMEMSQFPSTVLAHQTFLHNPLRS